MNGSSTLGSKIGLPSASSSSDDDVPFSGSDRILSTFLVGNIASYMTSSSDNTSIVAVSREAIQVIESAGKTFDEGRVIYRPSGRQVRLTGVQTTADHIVVTTEEGISVISDAPLDKKHHQEHDNACGSSILIAEHAIRDQSEQIHCLTCSPDGAYIATGSGTSNISVYLCNFSNHESASSFEPLIRTKYIFTGHTDFVKHLKLTQCTASSDKRYLLYSAGDDGRICQWDLEKGKLCSCVQYSKQSLSVFEVSFNSGLIAIASQATKAMLVVYRAFPLPSTDSAAEQMETGNFVVRSFSSERSIPTQHVMGECPMLRFETEALITGAHNGTPTSAKFTEDSKWIVSVGEDELLTISSISETPLTYRCSQVLTRHSCFALYNILLSVCVLASPPSSSVIVVLACSSDGTLIQWVVDPRNGRTNYTKKVQLSVGTLMAVDAQQQAPRRLFYF